MTPTSPEEMIREVDKGVIMQFEETGMAIPAVTLFAKDGTHVINVLALFQAADPEEATRKKAALTPTVHEYVTRERIEVVGYVFVCQAFKANRDDHKTAKELAQGKAIAKLSNRVPIVVYCAEMFDLGGRIVRAYGEREIGFFPRKLMELRIKSLDCNIVRIGFGILEKIPHGRRR